MLKPLGNQILIESVVAKPISAGGIHIPEAMQDKSQEATVLALGTGRRNEKGDLVPFEVKVGDRVLVSAFRGSEVKLNGKECRIVPADDVMAIIEP